MVELQQRLQVTSVVVTHDLLSAFSVGDSVALLQDGQIAEIAAPKDFAASRNPAVRKFIEAQFAGMDIKELLRGQ